MTVSWREFRSQPSLSAVAVITLALGVAGATTMFTLVRAIGSGMVPPGVDPSRVGRVAWTSAQQPGARTPLTGGEFLRLQGGVAVLESLSASIDQRLVLGGVDGPSVSAKQITAEFFRTFGCTPIAGRLFGPAELHAPSRVAIVSEGLLQREPGLGLGKLIRLGSEDYTVIGVMPARCWFPTPGATDVWLPMQTTASGAPTSPTVVVTARLRPTAPLALAQSQLGSIGQHLSQTLSPGLGRRLRMITLAEDAQRRLGQGVIGFLGPPLVVLLIACANVANLLLARAPRREKEMAIRAALGASRLRLVRERLVENAWLGLAGGMFGVALGLLGVRLLRLWVGGFESARSAAEMITLDGRALLFALAVTVAVPIVFGLVPALAASKPDLTQALHHAPGRRRPRRGPYGGRDLLVVAEIGLAVVLVVTTVMITRLFAKIGQLDWGFDPSKVLVVELSHTTDPARGASAPPLVADIVEAVSHLRGVRAAAVGAVPGVAARSAARPIEFERCASASDSRSALALNVGPGYFDALGLPVRRGRAVTDGDTAGSVPVGVISEKHAARCWPGQDPLGRRFRQGGVTAAPWVTVVGVVPDSMTTPVLPDGGPPVYLPYAQRNSVPDGLLVRFEGDVGALAKAVRAAIRRVDPTQPLDRIERLDERIRQGMGGASLLTGILGGFAVFALGLGALGVFSVMSYMVAERSREFGIRIALGAPRRRILSLVLKQAVIIVAIGTAVSVTGTLAVTRVTFRELADLAIADPVLWASVSVVIAVVAIGASIVPAHRATRVEPVVALRAE